MNHKTFATGDIVVAQEGEPPGEPEAISSRDRMARLEPRSPLAAIKKPAGKAGLSLANLVFRSVNEWRATIARDAHQRNLQPSSMFP
jgi:hypothetical protein